MVPGRIVLLLFLAAQIWDGILTYGAVQSFGVAAEGNVLLATWMGLAGAAPVLIGAKALAAACGFILYVHKVHRTLAMLTVFYIAAAIGPWLAFYRSQNWLG